MSVSGCPWMSGYNQLPPSGKNHGGKSTYVVASVVAIAFAVVWRTFAKNSIKGNA